MQIFTDKCVVDIEANLKKIEETVERSLMLATPLAPVIGYDKANASPTLKLFLARSAELLAAEPQKGGSA